MARPGRIPISAAPRVLGGQGPVVGEGPEGVVGCRPDLRNPAGRVLGLSRSGQGHGRVDPRRGPRLPRGPRCDEVPGGEGFQGLVHGGPGQPGAGDQVEAALRPALGVFEGFVDERGGVAEFPEHRPQRVQLPGLPGDARARSAISSGIRSWYRSPARPRSFSIRSISGSSSSRNARRCAATVVWSNPVATDRDRTCERHALGVAQSAEFSLMTSRNRMRVHMYMTIKPSAKPKRTTATEKTALDGVPPIAGGVR